MINITILDTFAIPAAKYDILKTFGNVTVFVNTPADKAIILERTKNINVVLINKTPLNADIIASFKSVELIIETASGYDNIAVDAATKHGITVCNVPAYSTRSVAEHVFALILTMQRKIIQCHQQVSQGSWITEKLLGFELAGKTIGLIGFGEIGRAVANIAQGFAMHVLAYTKNPDKYRHDYPKTQFVGIEKIMQNADIVSLHIPHNIETHHMISDDLLNLMKPGALLVNTARGKIIDEKALIKTAKKGHIAVCLDVLTYEGVELNNELLQLPNVLITPHVGWYTDAALNRLLQIVYENIKNYYQDTPINVA